MADIKTWTLAEQRAEFRKDTGRSETADISDADINELLNDYYVNHFPSDAKVDEFDVFFEQALSSTDSGVYPIAQNIDRLDDPVTVNGNTILFTRDRELFFNGEGSINTSNATSHTFSTDNYGFGRYQDEQYITDPGLAIGTDKTKVLYDAFSYRVNDYSYSAVTAEVDLTGSAIPQGKYGAWSLRIDEDGTVTVAAASDNATGYNTPRKALEALTESDEESAYMGYVTVTKSDGVFTPATTELDAANVTATFTDGRFEIRGTPTIALLYGQDLYLRPKADDIYELKALSIADRPTAFQDDTSVPDDPKWGPMIVTGTAILYLQSKHDDARANELITTMKYYKDGVSLDKYKRLKKETLQATF